MINYLKDNFKLTGSRYMYLKGFTGITENTDWDFVAKEGDPKIAETLELYGHMHHSSFSRDNPKAEESYMDKATIAVHKFGLNGELQLIVKKKEFFQTYLTVFANISVDFYTQYIWKGKGLTREQIQHNIGLLLSYAL